MACDMPAGTPGIQGERFWWWSGSDRTAAPLTGRHRPDMCLLRTCLDAHPDLGAGRWTVLRNRRKVCVSMPRDTSFVTEGGCAMDTWDMISIASFVLAGAATLTTCQEQIRTQRRIPFRTLRGNGLASHDKDCSPLPPGRRGSSSVNEAGLGTHIRPNSAIRRVQFDARSETMHPR